MRQEVVSEVVRRRIVRERVATGRDCRQKDERRRELPEEERIDERKDASSAEEIAPAAAAFRGLAGRLSHGADTASQLMDSAKRKAGQEAPLAVRV